MNSPTRIIGLDIARALAIAGMVLVNIKIVMDLEVTGSWTLWYQHFIEGRAAALFVVLAGIGLTLSIGKHQWVDYASKALKRNHLLKRGVALFVIGLLLYPIWPADILHFYGAYFAVAAWFLYKKTHFLFIAAGVSLVIAWLLMGLLNYELGWNWMTLEHTDFWTPRGFVRNLFFNGFHPVFPWIAFLFIGMALGKMDLRHRNTRIWIGSIGILIAVTMGTISELAIAQLGKTLSASDFEEIQYLLMTSPIPPTPFYIIEAAGLAMVAISLSIEIGLRFEKHFLVQVIQRTGQCALTLYVAHILFAIVPLNVIGASGFPELFASTAVFMLIGTLFATIWLSRFRKGPLEFLLGKIT
jgi:uncharacterized protein